MGNRYNTRFKHYPDGTLAQIMICSSSCFREEKEEGKSRPRIPSLIKLLEETENASAAFGDQWEHEEAVRLSENLRRSKGRARRRIYDLAMCNDFDLFVTLTLSPDQVNRYDYGDIVRILNRWLDNRVRRKGLRYLVVPEFHKDGAIHFHGLFNDVLRLVDSGHVDKRGHAVYNLPDWTLGFTTAIHLYGERHAVSGYVTKYITKAEQRVGGRWYLHGGDLQEPTYTYGDLDFDADLAGAFYYEPPVGPAFKILNLQ